MCGFSGLPKLRQLVSPSGSAPTQARLAEHSSTASTAPRYGSAATRRPLPSIATAMAGRAPSRDAGHSAAGSRWLGGGGGRRSPRAGAGGGPARGGGGGGWGGGQEVLWRVGQQQHRRVGLL